MYKNNNNNNIITSSLLSTSTIYYLSISFIESLKIHCNYQQNYQNNIDFNILIPPEFVQIHNLIETFKYSINNNFIYDEFAFILLGLCNNINNEKINNNYEYIYFNFFISKQFHDIILNMFNIYCFPIAPNKINSSSCFIQEINSNNIKTIINIINHNQLTNLQLSINKNILVLYPYVKSKNYNNNMIKNSNEFEKIVTTIDGNKHNISSLLMVFELNIKENIKDNDNFIISKFENIITLLINLNYKDTLFVKDSIKNICSLRIL